jgi:hypothetical protein
MPCQSRTNYSGKKTFKWSDQKFTFPSLPVIIWYMYFGSFSLKRLKVYPGNPRFNLSNQNIILFLSACVT